MYFGFKESFTRIHFFKVMHDQLFCLSGTDEAPRVNKQECRNYIHLKQSTKNVNSCIFYSELRVFSFQMLSIPGKIGMIIKEAC